MQLVAQQSTNCSFTRSESACTRQCVFCGTILNKWRVLLWTFWRLLKIPGVVKLANLQFVRLRSSPRSLTRRRVRVRVGQLFLFRGETFLPRVYPVRFFNKKISKMLRNLPNIIMFVCLCKENRSFRRTYRVVFYKFHLLSFGFYCWCSAVFLRLIRLVSFDLWITLKRK